MTDLLHTPARQTAIARHARWVKVCHWLVTASAFALAFTGVVILMAHPRLYWGEVGSDLTPALLELPISRNHRHGGWEGHTAFPRASSAVSANRTYDIFNQNGWGRSLHFLAAWVLAVSGAVYLIAGIVSGHFSVHLWPRPRELAPRLIWTDLVRHLRPRIPQATGGPQYGVLQKCAYAVVVFVGLPLAVLTGLAMSPKVTAAYPFLLGMFGGFQSARTIHFAAFVGLVLFAIVHVMMVVTSGFKRQMREMTWGE